MFIKTLALATSLFVGIPKDAQNNQNNSQNNSAVAQEQVIDAKINVSAIYNADKTIEQIVAVAKIPLSQLGALSNGRQRTGFATVTITETAQGKRTITRRNIEKTSEVYQQAVKSLEESITFYKKNHKVALNKKK